jgi:DNA topoisomerase-3
MTGRWEQRLRRMERGQDALEPFMRDIASYVREVVGEEATKPSAPRQARPRRKAATKSRNRRVRKRRAPTAGPPAGKAPRPRRTR